MRREYEICGKIIAGEEILDVKDLSHLIPERIIRANCKLDAYWPLCRMIAEEKNLRHDQVLLSIREIKRE